MNLKISLDSTQAQRNAEALTVKLKALGKEAQSTDKAVEKFNTRLKDRGPTDLAGQNFDRFTKNSIKAKHAIDRDEGERDRSTTYLSVSRNGGTLKQRREIYAASVMPFIEGAVAGGEAVGDLLKRGKKAVQDAGDLEKELKRFQAAKKADPDQMKNAEMRAREMGLKTEFSPAQAFKGFVELQHAKLDTPQALAALPGAMDLATAAQITPEQAALHSGKIKKSMELLPQDMGRINDMIVHSINRANVTVPELAAAFQKVGKSAQASGHDLEQVGAILVSLVDQGVQIKDAGTGLDAAFKVLPETFKALKVDGQGKGFVEALKEMQKAGWDAAQVQKLLGKEAAAAYGPLLGQADAVENLNAAYRKGAGINKQVAEAERDTLSGALDGLLSAVGDVSDEIYGLFSGDLKKGFQEATQWIVENKLVLVDLGEVLVKIFKIVKTILIAMNPTFILVRGWIEIFTRMKKSSADQQSKADTALLSDNALNGKYGDLNDEGVKSQIKKLRSEYVKLESAQRGAFTKMGEAFGLVDKPEHQQAIQREIKFLQLRKKYLEDQAAQGEEIRSTEQKKNQDLLDQLQVEQQLLDVRNSGSFEQAQSVAAASEDPAKIMAREEAQRLYDSTIKRGSAEWADRAIQEAFQKYEQIARDIGGKMGEEMGQRFFAQKVEEIGQTKEQFDQQNQKDKESGKEEFGKPLMDATGAMLKSASSMYNLAMAIPSLANAIMNMVTDLLKAWRDLGSKIGNWLKSLPTLLRDSIHGLADLFTEALGTLLTAEFLDRLINGFFEGFQRALAQIFGGGERQVTEAQVAALKELTKSIRGWVTDLQRADWGPQDWGAEFKRLQSEREGLDRGASDYWDRYIDLSKQQFETLKKIKDSTEASRTTLQGVLNTLKSTLEQISGAQYNPELQSLDAKTARFNELLAAAQESGISAKERQDRVGQLTGYSTQYLDAAQAQLRSSQGYRDIYQAVVAGLESVQQVTQNDLDGLSSGPDLITQANSLADAVEAPTLGPESKGILQMILDSLEWIAGILTNVQGGINALKSVFEGVAKILSDIWTGLTDSFGALGGMLKTLFKDLGGLISGAWHAIMDLGSAIWGAASSVVKGIWDNITRAITEISSNFYNAVVKMIRELPRAIYDAVMEALPGGGGGIGGLGSSHWSGLSDQRLKSNVHYGQELLPGVRQAYWDWNGQGQAKGHFGAGAGVIAQDLARVLPSLVREVAGYKQVDYAGLSQLVGDRLQIGGYADGGISYGPQLAWVSEGRFQAEAHVPLPNGKSIPVEIKGGSKEGENQRLDRLVDRLGELVDIQRSIRDKGGPVVVFDLDQMGRSLANQTGERKQRGGLNL
ncbi:MAG: phage tail tape measure protein [bacterium]|nr:phage tail tape measure protein [bacterium]